MLKGAAATALLRSTMWENWLKPGTSIGVAAGAVVLMLTIALSRPVAGEAVRDRASVVADRAPAGS